MAWVVVALFDPIQGGIHKVKRKSSERFLSTIVVLSEGIAFDFQVAINLNVDVHDKKGQKSL